MKSLRRLFQSKAAVIGGMVLFIALFIAVFGPYLSPHDPFKQNLKNRLKAPSWLSGGAPGHLLGTDQLGRDVLSRIIWGTRNSLLIALSAVSISGCLGVLLGLLCGYYGGKLDTVIMRLADIQLAFPFILLVIAIVAVVGTSLLNVILVFGLAGWVIYARTERSIVLSLKEKEFVEAARALGFRDRLILLGHILPNTLPSIIVIATVRVGQIIIWESGLSFLGLGIPPPTISWGSMLADGRPYLSTGWWVCTYPGLAIMAVVLALNLLGDAMVDAFDPRFSRESS